MPRVMPVLALTLLIGACGPSSPGDTGASDQAGGARRAAAAPDSTPDGRLPHIVLYLVDTLRADRMSLYGHERTTTPFLDALSAESVVFERAMSQAPWTLPSTVSLFTSTYPSSHGVLSGFHKLSESAQTLVEFMQGLGYHTMGFVTNGLGGTGAGLDQGYDEFFQRPTLTDMTDEMRAAGLHTGRPLMDMLRGYDGSKPLFLYVHAVEPHSPYQGAPPSAKAAQGWHDLDAAEIDALNKLESEYRGLLRRRYRGEPREGDLARMATLEPEVLAQMQTLWSLYDGDILRADLAISRLVAMLKAQRLWDDTAFLLVSDHGEEFLEHGLTGHDQSLYQELVHVPLMVRVPGLTDQGGRVSQRVQVLDIGPTLADLIGVDPLPFWQGRSFLPALAGESLEPRPALAVRANLDRLLKGQRGDRESAWVTGRWKLIVHHDMERVSLFDLTADPTEQHDLSAEQPERAAAMRSELMAALRALPQLPLRAEEVGLDDEKLKQMGELGYLEKLGRRPGGR
ncbi:MAG: hypothetical protein DRQ55_07500 [Planctomycetota bacterium]|nr:MAG: hypothetical protein DRQ55_07500 [Planctomycetota bacterium]